MTRGDSHRATSALPLTLSGRRATMPPVPTPDDLGGLPRVAGARPAGGYDLTSYASGAQRMADAGARLGEQVADAGKAVYKAGRQQAMTEAVNANAFIHAGLIEAR